MHIVILPKITIFIKKLKLQLTIVHHKYLNLLFILGYLIIMFSTSSDSFGALPMEVDLDSWYTVAASTTTTTSTSSTLSSDSSDIEEHITTHPMKKKKTTATTVPKKIIAAEVMKKKIRQLIQNETTSPLKYFRFDAFGKDSVIPKTFARALWKQGKYSSKMLSPYTKVSLNLTSNFDVNLIMEMPQGVIYEFDYRSTHIYAVNGYDYDETTPCVVFAFRYTDANSADQFMEMFYRAACVFYKKQKENPVYVSAKIIRNSTSTTHQFRPNSLHYLSGNKYSELVTDLTTFLSDREDYEKFGITGTRVYHVEGSQNIGKKMLIYKLAHDHNLDVVQLTSTLVLNPAEIHQELSAIFSSMSRNGIVICDCENDTSFVETQLKTVIDAFKLSTLCSAIFVMNLGMQRSNVKVEFDYIVEYEKPSFKQIESLCYSLIKDSVDSEEIKKFYAKIEERDIPLINIREILFKIRNKTLADADTYIKDYKPVKRATKRTHMYI